jgi:hypothetical protein
MAVPCRSPSVRSAVAGLLSIVTACSPGAAEPASERSLSPIVLASTPPKAAAKLQPPSAIAERGGEYFAGTDVRQDDILRELGRARMLYHRPVGSTSIVWKTALDAPLHAALKLPTRDRPLGPVAEIAAYRLARLLGLDNVPPAVPRRVDKDALREALDPTFLWQWPGLSQRLITGRDGKVLGAMIYWIEAMRDLGLEREHVRQRIEALSWLRFGGEAPPGRQLLAAQLSNMFAFDYLVGNWDRWSGENLQGDQSGEQVYMRDNDSAFARRLPESLQRRMLVPLQATQHFSRNFVLALQALNRSKFEQALRSEELGGAVKLDPRAVNGVFDRRDALLSHVAALIEQYSEAQVLVYR